MKFDWYRLLCDIQAKIFRPILDAWCCYTPLAPTVWTALPENLFRRRIHYCDPLAGSGLDRPPSIKSERCSVTMISEPRKRWVEI
jgi:putative component of membrane protein insertase Oxa1/YidC/SpoIIIJ protein YidD